ncbi:nucleoside hydrolase [uncultured Amnibacterium sp.]|uniref:nucleoside hydrolase n=1 Tax=uncultured Amnibacterium sp. TaxID=1631851 RepID=UPI0035CBC62C
MNQPVILDVDTGLDDAMAIMFAVRHPDIDVRAISCVAGNVNLDQVVVNTLKILDLIDAPPIPVAAGATRPLVEPVRDAAAVHGPSGLGGLELPPSRRSIAEVRSVELLRRTLLDAETPVTIVALAPLTNVALLLRVHPEVVDRIARIVFMGGSASVGNASAVAEFNVWHDPEAAHIVINSGIPLVMYGLDVFNEVLASRETIAELHRSGDRVSRALGSLLGHEIVDPERGTTTVVQGIGDAGAVCAAVRPELFTFERRPLQVALAPGIGRGQTVVDRRGRGSGSLDDGPRDWPRAEVALGVRTDEVLQLFFDTVLQRH